MNLKLVASSGVMGEFQRLNPGTLGTNGGAIHLDIEALANVKGLQIGASIQDSSHPCVGELTVEQLKGAQLVHLCNLLGFLVLVMTAPFDADKDIFGQSETLEVWA